MKKLLKEEKKEYLRISVRNLVEFVMQAGDISSGFSGNSRMLEGTKAHQSIQKSSGDNYLAEVSLNYPIETDSIVLEVCGRVDGIITEEDGSVTIDEIKTTSASLKLIDENFNPLHIAQAKCYAFIYAKQNALENIDVRLTYFQIDVEEIKYLEWSFDIIELEVFFSDLVNSYLGWANTIQGWLSVRNSSIKEIEFPFDNYRKGQREFAVSVYRAIRDENLLFAEAPTGIGKTMASIFPAVKALAEGLAVKIFYLTAKTITRTVAEKSIDILRSKGLKLKVVTITAKEKICFKEKVSCNPIDCEFAKGHFDRIRVAIEDIFKEDSFTRENIEEYAKKHKVCPFEFSLDLSLFADCVICDYNYVFDPRVYLKRFFAEGKGEFIFLIDEAHNLVDRGREMFSAEFSKTDIMELKRALKDKHGKIYEIVKEINTLFIKLRKSYEEDEEKKKVEVDHPKELSKLLRKFIRIADEILSKNKNFEAYDLLLDTYFKASIFIKISEFYDEKYCTYYEKKSSDLKIKMFCIDPSRVLAYGLARGKAAMIFSATLSPIEYFLESLGGNDTSTKLRLSSPFPKENLCILIDNKVATKYSARELTYGKVAEDISLLSRGKQGNYLIYFPSYKYLNEVYERFIEMNPEAKAIYQKPNMTEEEKDEFLKEFKAAKEETMVAFAVMGGIFGEGIDLAGDMLLGAAIVGVGLPQVCLEREIMMKYFGETKGSGFEYAYIFPGMNKVMQAVGRVIRTEEDRGVVLLIDERFNYKQYKSLFPRHWEHNRIISNEKGAKKVIEDFWNKKEIR